MENRDIRIISDAYTRPADTTAYAANDTLSDSTTDPSVLTFDDCSHNFGRGGEIQGIRVIDSAYVAGLLPDFDLLLFDTAPTAPDDNAAVALTDAEVATIVGVISIDGSEHGYVTNPAAGASGNIIFVRDDLQMRYTCASASKDLYGVVVMRNAYVPVSAEVFTFELIVDRETN